MRPLRIPPSPLIFLTPGHVTSKPLQSPLWSFTSRMVNHDVTPWAMMLHGSLDARNFSLRTIHTPNATQAEPTSLGTQYAHICRNGSLDHKHSWGHPSFFFLVLEGPLSGDTHPSTPHRINPAVHHQIYIFSLFFLTAPLSSVCTIFFFTFLFPQFFCFFFYISESSSPCRRASTSSRRSGFAILNRLATYL